MLVFLTMMAQAGEPAVQTVCVACKTTTTLDALLEERMEDIRACYQEQIRTMDSGEPKVDATFLYSGNGTVQLITVNQTYTSVYDNTANDCFRAIVREYALINQRPPDMTLHQQVIMIGK